MSRSSFPVGFRTMSLARQLRLFDTISSGRQAVLRFRLPGPAIFATGYCSSSPCGAWCFLRFPSGLRYSAFCPGGGEFGVLLRDALCDRAEDRCLAAWCADRAACRSPACCYRVDWSLRVYRVGRCFLLPQSTVPTVVRVVRSFILRRFGDRYYHYVFLTGVFPDAGLSSDPTVATVDPPPSPGSSAVDGQ